MAKKKYVVDGIPVSIDERVFKDYRILELQVSISEPLPDEKDPDYNKAASEKGAATVTFINKVLGSEKDHVMEAIAKKNDGFCDVEVVSDWLAKLLEKVNNAKK